MYVDLVACAIKVYIYCYNRASFQLLLALWGLHVYFVCPIGITVDLLTPEELLVIQLRIEHGAYKLYYFEEACYVVQTLPLFIPEHVL